MASKVLSSGKRGAGAKSHKTRVNTTAAMQKKLDKKLLEPQIVNEDRLERDRIASGLDANSIGFTRDDAHKWRYPITASHMGRYLRPDERDTDMQIRKSMIQQAPGYGAGSTPYGMMTVGPEVIDYFKQKKEQEAYVTELALGEYLIDSKRPETQEKAYAIFPELMSVPDEWYQTNLALQEALRTLLRDGQIRGPDDNSLIAKIVRDDFLLPLLPAWDPSGVIVQNLDAFKELMSKGYRRGIFNPRQWGMMESVDKEEQRKIKRLILRRLYPGLRESDDNEVNAVIKKMSAVFPGTSMEQSPFTMGAETMDAFRGPGNETYVGTGLYPSAIVQGGVRLPASSSGGVVREF